MRPTIDVWLEIVKGQLAAGDSAVQALSKAGLVADEYTRRFSLSSALSPAAARAWFEKLAMEAKQNEQANLSIPFSGYVAGDENARS